MSDTTRQAVIVGTFVTIGLVILSAGVVTIGGMSDQFTRSVYVTAVFPDVAGLQAGDNVWFSGVKVGSVQAVRFDGGSSVAVDLSVEESASVFVKKDSVAKISSDGLIGNRIVVLTVGSDEAKPITDGDVLAIEPMLSTDEMMAKFQQNNDNLLAITNNLKLVSAKLASEEGTVGRLLSDEQLFADAKDTMSTLRTASANASEMTSNLASLSREMNAPGKLPRQILDDQETYASLQSSVKKLEGVAGEAQTIVDGLGEATANASTPLGTLLYDQEAGADLKMSLDNLSTGTKTLNEDLEAAQSNFLLRGYFKKKEKEEAKAAEEASK